MNLVLFGLSKSKKIKSYSILHWVLFNGTTISSLYLFRDRGFNIGDLLAGKDVTLNIPPRLTDSQLSGDDHIVTLRSASVCVHVKRAIGGIKTFRILESIPNTMQNIANQVFYVCCLLTNFQPRLVE